MTITVEADPPPIVRIVATTLRRSEADPALRQRLSKMRGIAALKSATDSQAATIRFANGAVHVERGVASDVGVVITADLATMNDEHPPSPKVSGALAHPLFALALSKVLDPPKGTWQQAAERFWAFATSTPGLPASMLVVNTDTEERLTVGNQQPAAPAPIELHGSTHDLTVVLSGNSVLGEDVLAGKLRMVASLEHLARLTGRSLAYLLDGAPT